jgi:hypothetical protein
LSWKNKLKNFIDFYKADLSNIEGLDAELDMWETRWVKTQRLQFDTNSTKKDI